MQGNHPLDRLATTQRSLSRVQDESFTFRLHRGDVLVTNHSYDDPSDHVYRVAVGGGVPVDCTCPADATYPPACKHRVAVAMRRPILAAVDRMQVAADGGTVEQRAAQTSPDASVSESESQDCECSGLPDGTPCWPCYRAGEATFGD